MLRDPRNPDPKYMRRTVSTHPFHADLRNTLNLLRFKSDSFDLYLVVRGLHEWPATFDDLPTNFIGTDLVCYNGDSDPHELFDLVEAVWLMDEYPSSSNDRRDYLCKLWPVLEKKA